MAVSLRNLLRPRLYFMAITLLIVACSTGHCRRDGSGKVLERVDAKPPAGYEEGNLGSIWVFKADGSQQCGYRKGLSLGDMAKQQLEGVKIISSKKQSDGMMRIQKCGASTGMLNTYEIRHQDMRAAQKAGFEVLKSKK